MIEKKTYYNVKCDYCGEHASKEKWHEQEHTLASATERWMHLGGKDYCPDCWQWDKNGNIKTRDGKVWTADGTQIGDDMIFNGARFGSFYKTRNGKKAIYICKEEVQSDYCHTLVVECKFQGFTSGLLSFDQYGRYNKKPHMLDIVGKWEEPIDEGKLDADTNLYASNITSDPDMFTLIRNAAEYGYRKRAEEVQ